MSVAKVVVRAYDFLNKNEDIICIKAYDDNADIVLSRFKKGDRITFIGIVRENYVEIYEIEL